MSALGVWRVPDPAPATQHPNRYPLSKLITVISYSQLYVCERASSVLVECAPARAATNLTGNEKVCASASACSALTYCSLFVRFRASGSVARVVLSGRGGAGLGKVRRLHSDVANLCVNQNIK